MLQPASSLRRSNLRYLVPFWYRDWMADLEAIESEQMLNDAQKQALRAKLIGITLTSFVLFGIPINFFRTIRISENELLIINTFSLFDGRLYPVEIVSMILYGLFVFAVYFYLGEFLIRMTINTLGFVWSADPNTWVGRKVYGWPWRIMMFILGMLALTLYLVSIYLGWVGWTKFMIPRGEFPLSAVRFLVLTAVLWTTVFIIWPSMYERSFSEDGLIKLANAIAHGANIQSLLNSQKEVISLPKGDPSSNTLLEPIKKKGYEVIRKWKIAANGDHDKWDEYKEYLVSQGYLSKKEAARLIRVRYAEQDGVRHLALEMQDEDGSLGEVRIKVNN